MLLSSFLPTTTFPFLDTTNISLYTIPAAWILCLYPHIYAIVNYTNVAGTTPSFFMNYEARNSATSTANRDQHDPKFEFDKTYPRSFLSRLEANPNPAITPEFKARIARAEAASLNGYENLGLYAASVVAANVALVYLSLRGGSPSAGIRQFLRAVNLTSIEFLLCRVLFNVLYIQGASGGGRGIWFYGSIFCCIELAVKAGNVLRHL